MSILLSSRTNNLLIGFVGAEMPATVDSLIQKHLKGGAPILMQHRQD
jgi:hypothetical protein